MSDVLLDVRHLKKYFPLAKDVNLHAVDDVTFTIERGKTLGIVGESGCGKSTMGRCVLRLIEPTDGEVWFDGENICKLNKAKMRELRKDMQIIFQDPFSSLDPRMTVAQAIEEPIRAAKIMPGASRQELRKRVAELMDTVGLASRLTDSYPHELDGGRRQRIGIARALAMNPKLIVCDEPVSALDVSIQAQILNLLSDLQEQIGLTYIFITHDLSVVNHFSDDIAVMYLGQIVEKAPAEELFANPLHPYTQALLSAIPVPAVRERKERILLRGELSSPINPPDECRFAKRCNYACEQCSKSCPTLVETRKDHFVACHLVNQG